MRIVLTLQKGLEVLDHVAQANGAVFNADIAERLGMDKANVSRLLQTLCQAGYVAREGNRGFVLGPKMRIDRQRTLQRLIGLRERSRFLLDGLVKASGECSHMAVLVGDKVWYIDKVSSPHPLKVDHPVGSLAPLHCTALGKVYLAFAEHAAAGELTAFTARTILGRDALAEDIARVRARGFAIDDEEFATGVRCVAAPLRDSSGTMVAAIGLSGPTARIDRTRLAELGELVRNRCAPDAAHME